MAHSGQRAIVLAEHRYGEPDEEPTVRDATVVSTAPMTVSRS